ncbi:MAG: hypothetical protein WAU68_08715 [Vitreimonas sp.]
MNTPSDPFSESFDSIEIDPARKPSIEAIDHALAICAPADGLDAPGFYLLDDAGGRFVIDRDWGVISLRDESVLEQSRGATHVARLRVIEQSGETYELDLTLRLTGMVPQLITEDGAIEQDADDADLPPIPRIHWTRYVAVAGLYTPASLPDAETPFGSMLAVHLPCVAAGFAGLTLIDELPSPAKRGAIWTP